MRNRTGLIRVGALTGCMLLVLLLVLVACGPPEAASLSGGAAPEKKVTRLTISGASIGSVATLVANMDSSMVKKYLGIESTVITHPSQTVSDALHRGLADIVSMSGSTADMAYSGTGVYDGQKPYSELRRLVTIVQNAQQWVVLAKSPYKKFSDLIGKKICVGKKSSNACLEFFSAVTAMGFNPEKDFQLSYAGWEEEAANFVTGKVDCLVVGASPPHPTMTEVDLVHPIRLVQFELKDLATIESKVPFEMRMKVPPKFYHMTEETWTYSTFAGKVTTAALPEEIAYGLVKNYIEHPEFVKLYQSTHAEAITDGSVKQWVETIDKGMPYHAGALRYFLEKGWKVPQSKYPPEWKK